MFLASDNTAGAAPEVVEAIAAASGGVAAAYGGDGWTARLVARLAEVFEHPVEVFPVATGTGANALALATLTPPWGAVFCHPESHVERHEAGAPELYTGGAKLVGVGGRDGKVDPEALAARLGEEGGPGDVHQVVPSALSLTQLTEAGTAYSVGELEALGDVARAHGLAVHLDGARFANAVVATGRTPAELTWRAGVDVVCFGGTKNGAVAAEAVVYFDAARAATAGHRRKRGGLLCSKQRFLSAQLLALLDGDRWLAFAAHANGMAARLAAGVRDLDAVQVLHPVDGNLVFLELPRALVDALAADGFRLSAWGRGARARARLVTAFDTDPGDVDRFLAAIRHRAAG